MPLSRWDNIPRVMDVKLNQVPYTVLCKLDSFKHNKNGTYPIIGYGKDIVTEWSGTIAKVSGVITTEYEQMVPLVVVGRAPDTHERRYRLLVPIFDYDIWSIACGNPELGTVLDYNTFWNIVTQNNTLGFTKVAP